MSRARTSQKAARLADSVFPRWTRLAVQHHAVNLSQGFPDFQAEPVLFDGRNLFEPDHVSAAGFTYHSIGRVTVLPRPR